MLGRPRPMWKDNNEMGPREIVWRGIVWTNLLQDRNQ